MDFQSWLRAVDRYVSGRIGLSIHDLEDYMWRAEYDSGASPEEAGRQFLIELGLGESGPFEAMVERNYRGSIREAG